MKRMKRYLDAERCAIMERIDERCKTDMSPKAMATGREDDFVTVIPYPFIGSLRAQFAWETADRITKTSLIFRLR